ncbi:MAG: Pr6Pr family membrane protein [Anaeroplasmataceae bacterium]
MINNRIVQLIYRTIFLTISLFGIIESFGLFAGQTPGLGCLVYYTSLSNFLCFGVMMAVWISTLKYINKNELRGYNTCVTHLKFSSTIIILVTFLVYNFILADSMFEEGWNSLGNLTKHIICPLLFIFDYLLFDKHHSVKWYDPLLCTVLPLIYVIFILIRGAILPSDYSGTIYPYFFLDVNELGLGGVCIWVLILVIVFVVIAYLLFLYDKIEYKDKKISFSLKNK